MTGFKEKVFLITGSSKGLGREMAAIVLESGGKVVLNGRSEASTDELAQQFKQYKGCFTYCAADISKANEAEKLVSHAIDTFGKLDALINNGGMSAFGDLRDTAPNVIEQILDSNLKGSLLMSHFAIPHLEKTKGSIEFISSLAAIHGIGGYSLYSASKMAYLGAAQSLRKELKSSGIHVGTMFLGFTKNDPTKVTLNPKGDLEVVPVRKGLPVATQTESATLILNQIRSRKSIVVHSAFGKLTYVVNRIAPRLIHAVLLNQYRKQNRSK
jgi:short-subunit dehydrogenase